MAKSKAQEKMDIGGLFDGISKSTAPGVTLQSKDLIRGVVALSFNVPRALHDLIDPNVIITEEYRVVRPELTDGTN